MSPSDRIARNLAAGEAARRLARLLFAALLLPALISCRREKAPFDPETWDGELASIRGQVLMPEDAGAPKTEPSRSPPLAGASVRIVETEQTAKTGPDGSFAFEKAPAGIYTFEILKEGMAIGLEAREVLEGKNCFVFPKSRQGASSFCKEKKGAGKTRADGEPSESEGAASEEKFFEGIPDEEERPDADEFQTPEPGEYTALSESGCAAAVNPPSPLPSKGGELFIANSPGPETVSVRLCVDDSCLGGKPGKGPDAGLTFSNVPPFPAHPKRLFLRARDRNGNVGILARATADWTIGESTLAEGPDDPEDDREYVYAELDILETRLGASGDRWIFQMTLAAPPDGGSADFYPTEINAYGVQCFNPGSADFLNPFDGAWIVYLPLAEELKEQADADRIETGILPARTALVEGKRLARALLRPHPEQPAGEPVGEVSYRLRENDLLLSVLRADIEAMTGTSKTVQCRFATFMNQDAVLFQPRFIDVSPLAAVALEESP